MPCSPRLCGLSHQRVCSCVFHQRVCSNLSALASFTTTESSLASLPPVSVLVISTYLASHLLLSSSSSSSSAFFFFSSSSSAYLWASVCMCGNDALSGVPLL